MGSESTPGEIPARTERPNPIIADLYGDPVWSREQVSAMLEDLSVLRTETTNIPRLISSAFRYDLHAIAESKLIRRPVWTIAWGIIWASVIVFVLSIILIALAWFAFIVFVLSSAGGVAS